MNGIAAEAVVTFLERAKASVASGSEDAHKRAAMCLEARIWLEAAEYLLQQATKPETRTDDYERGVRDTIEDIHAVQNGNEARNPHVKRALDRR